MKIVKLWLYYCVGDTSHSADSLAVSSCSWQDSSKVSALSSIPFSWGQPGQVTDRQLDRLTQTDRQRAAVGNTNTPGCYFGSMNHCIGRPIGFQMKASSTVSFDTAVGLLLTWQYTHTHTQNGALEWHKQTHKSMCHPKYHALFFSFLWAYTCVPTMRTHTAYLSSHISGCNLFWSERL